MLKSKKDKLQRVASSGVAVAADAAVVAPPITLVTPVRRIATFHLNGLGDLLFTLPALFALRESFPGASICSVVRPGIASLLQDSPLVDEVVLRPSGGLSGQAALMAKLHARHIDLAITFSQSRNMILLTWATGAPVRLGFGNAKMEALLTHRVPKLEGPYTIESNLDLVRAVGCQTRQHDYCGLVHIAPSYQQQADALLAEHGVTGPFIVAACAASQKRGIKEWSHEHWAAALDELAARWPVVLVGTHPTPEVTSLMRQSVIDLGGRTELLVLATLCGKARVFIGIDSGVLHLAAAMETPVIGIYGPSDWRLTGPRGVPHRIARHPVECSPCLLSKCKWTGADERKCLTRLEPQLVVQAARELIGV